MKYILHNIRILMYRKMKSLINIMIMWMMELRIHILMNRLLNWLHRIHRIRILKILKILRSRIII